MQSAWEGIKSRRVGVQRVWEFNIDQLQKELSEIRIKDGESVDDFSMQITGLANSITTLGGSISEIVEQVAVLIETLLDVYDLTVEEVTKRLRNVEQQKKNTISAVDKEGRLLLTEEEWLARLKLRDGTDESNGPFSRKGDKKPCKSRRRMHGKEADQKKEEPTDDGPIQCS